MSNNRLERRCFDLPCRLFLVDSSSLPIVQSNRVPIFSLQIRCSVLGADIRSSAPMFGLRRQILGIGLLHYDIIKPPPKIYQAYCSNTHSNVSQAMRRCGTYINASLLMTSFESMISTGKGGKQNTAKLF